LRFYKSGPILIFAVGCAAVRTVGAQAAAPDYFHQSLTGAFVYEVKVGPNSTFAQPLLNNAAGFSAGYWLRPRRWLALEAGFEQIVRPIGSSAANRYSTNADDQLYIVPFGVRYVLEPRSSRLRFTAGGGGAYLNHTIGDLSGGEFGFSGWGGQFVASGEYAVTRSGRLRLGVTARYYFASPKPSPDYGFSNDHLRILVFGPAVSFSIR
jgi:hypothetical protein